MERGYLLRNNKREEVIVKHQYLDRWLAWYDGRWRRVYIQVKRTFIVHKGRKIDIDIDGV